MQPLVIAWVSLEDITLNEIDPTQKDKYHVTSLICGAKDSRVTDQRVEGWSGLGGRNGGSWGKGQAVGTRMSQSKISCAARWGESPLF